MKHCTVIALSLTMFGLAAEAQTRQGSLQDQRPQARVSSETSQLGSLAVLRPSARSTEAAVTSDTATPEGFDAWRAGFLVKARSAGISSDTLGAATPWLRFNSEFVRSDGNQAEFVRPIWDYLDSAVSTTRISNGQEKLRQHSDILADIEARYGVDAEVVVAVWGLESAYGSFKGNHAILEAMATLAFDGRRRDFFEEQLIAALQIIQAGDTAPGDMRGSWAGAMGHTQFIPTSYLAYAVDFDGDGRRDIWSDDPTDALASTAAYLARFGWNRGEPWGVEVALPDGFDYRLTGASERRNTTAWQALGVRPTSGRDLPNLENASILVPAGQRGVALMVFDNFRVIKRYNSADAYAIGVGHLSDRLQNRPDFERSWPRDDQPLTRSQCRELQQRLTNAGFDTQGVDGRIGPNSISAIRAYQSSQGLVPDGYASLQLLERLRQ